MTEQTLDSADRELLDAFQKAEPVEHQRTSCASTVLSVRMSRTLLASLTRLARERDTPVGTLARTMIEEGVERRELDAHLAPGLRVEEQVDEIAQLFIAESTKWSRASGRHERQR